MIDAADVGLIAGANWQAIPRNDGKGFYACRTVKDAGQKSHFEQMHRLLTGVGAKEIADHRDGDGLNNRRANLRKCSKGQNQMNRRLTSSRTGFKGVSAAKGGKFVARIRVAGRTLTVARCDSAEDAALAYDAAALMHFGAFAATNAMMGRVNVG